MIERLGGLGGIEHGRVFPEEDEGKRLAFSVLWSSSGRVKVSEFKNPKILSDWGPSYDLPTSLKFLDSLLL